MRTSLGLSVLMNIFRLARSPIFWIDGLRLPVKSQLLLLVFVIHTIYKNPSLIVHQILAGYWPWVCWRQTLLDFHCIWLWWRWFNWLWWNYWHLPGTLSTCWHCGGWRSVGFMCNWCQVHERNNVNPNFSYPVLVSVVNIIYFRATIDGDGDGDISKEEFVTNAMQSKFIANLLTKQHYND